MASEVMNKTGFPSVDRPWMQYYKQFGDITVPDLSVYEYLVYCNKDKPNNTAITYFDKKYTYAQMFEMIETVAKGFRAMGIKPGDVVNVVSIPCVASTLTFYALNKIGAVADYINVLSTEKDFVHYFEGSKAKVVITLNLFASKVLTAAKNVSTVEKIVTFELSDYAPLKIKIGLALKTRKMDKSYLEDSRVTKFADVIKAGASLPKTDYKKDPQSVAIYAHTGGTTGFPKTVLLSDKAMNSVAHQYRCIMPHGENPTFLNIVIPFVVYGLLTCMHMPFALGANVIIIPKFEASEWKSYFEKYHFNFTAAVPAWVSPMLGDSSLDGVDMSCMDYIAVGGDGCTNDLEEQCTQFFNDHGSKSELHKGYGMTEVGATAVSTYPYANKVGSVGIPFPLNNFMIYDTETGKECQYGKVGEICMQAASQMIGYKDNEEENKNFTRIHEDGSEWIHTGDLGYIDEDGFIFLVGRIKRIIMTFHEGTGYKVFPNIPEEVIATHAAIQDVCVVEMTNDEQSRLKAFVSLKNGVDMPTEKVEAEIRDIVEAELPAYQQPLMYEFRDELPLTAAGKVDYRTLEEEA
ncbi:MAG: acyl--CoA ligase [Clostridia bacterium]|nr:acyl--CoA ligase [Clostridia bacterium]